MSGLVLTADQHEECRSLKSLLGRIADLYSAFIRPIKGREYLLMDREIEAIIAEEAGLGGQKGATEKRSKS